jgi:hypothetical protein
MRKTKLRPAGKGIEHHPVGARLDRIRELPGLPAERLIRLAVIVTRKTGQNKCSGDG